MFHVVNAMGEPSGWFAKALIDGANPSQADQSFDNYHVPGLTYVNLCRSPEFTAKLYIFEPGKWSSAAGRYVVHPHDHAYAFDTRVLAGEVGNHLFVEKDLELFTDRRWTFKPRVGFSEPRPVCLVNYRNRYYGEGDIYSMQPEEIHTISVEPEVPTVLFLMERSTVKGQTSCYLPPDMPPPTLDGLYQPMTQERYTEALAGARRMMGV